MSLLDVIPGQRETRPVCAPVRKPEPCHWCEKKRVPVGYQRGTGRPFCSEACFAAFAKGQGF